MRCAAVVRSCAAATLAVQQHRRPNGGLHGQMQDGITVRILVAQVDLVGFEQRLERGAVAAGDGGVALERSPAQNHGVLWRGTATERA